MYTHPADMNGPAELILNRREQANEALRTNAIESALEEKLRDEFNDTATADQLDSALGTVMDDPMEVLSMLIAVEQHREDSWLNASKFISKLRTEYVNEHRYTPRADDLRKAIANELEEF